MFENCVITNAGIEMLNAWAAGGEMTIDGATAGSGTAAAASLPSQTALVNTVQQPKIASKKVHNDRLELVVELSAASAQYTMRQTGIWAHLGSGESKLIAIYQDEAGVVVPSESDMPDFIYALHAIICVGQTATMEVTVDQSAAATMEDVAEVQRAVDALEAEMGYANRFVIVQQATPAVVNGKMWLRPLD